MKLPVDPPSIEQIVKDLAGDTATFTRLWAGGINPAPQGRYRHWDEIRFRTPPDGLTRQHWWLGIKLARATILKPLPLIGKDGRPFQFAMPDPALEMVQSIDRDASGRIQASEQVTNPATRDRYLVSSLIEEAITSSQLEGAATTYGVAKEMLRSGRDARDKNEQMILNNYHTMRHVRNLMNSPLTPELVLQLQRMLTSETLEDPTASGRLRTADEPVRVSDARDGTVLHVPPPSDQLEERLKLMCAFANGEIPNFYVHPVVRAALLHFWLAYDHPFVDGNGRTARALFYWSMLRSGYWLCEYLSISGVVKKMPGQYMRAYLYSETDGNDATYFVLFHLRVVRVAIRELHAYLERKMIELRGTEQLLRKSQLNHRQLALIGHALRHPGAEYSIESHRSSHDVVYQTARADLLDLTARGLLEKRRLARRFAFFPPVDLSEKVRAQASRRV
jgi:Fic family protein